MKKVFALMSIVAMFSMVACGPAKTNESDDAEKKRIEDSIAGAAAEAEVETEVEAEVAPMDSNAMSADTAVKMEEAAPAAH